MVKSEKQRGNNTAAAEIFYLYICICMCIWQQITLVCVKLCVFFSILSLQLGNYFNFVRNLFAKKQSIGFGKLFKYQYSK